MQPSRFSTDSWVILSEIEQSIKRKIEAVGTPLKDWNINIYRGILTGYNEAFIVNGEKRQEILANCKTEEEREKTDQLIRPILRGRDIKRYNYDFADLWLINTHNGVKEKGVKPVNIEDYPAVKKYLDQFYPQLEKRTDKGDTPYNLRNCAYIEDFSSPKLLWAETMRIHKQQIRKFPRFGYDSTGQYLTDKTCFFATGENLDFILCILNSAIGKYLCYQYVSILDDGGFLMQKIYIERIPIPQYNSKLVKLFQLLNNDWENGNLENGINSAIFELYSLTEEEIAFIEAQ